MAKLQNALPEIQKVIDGFSGNLAFKIVDEQTGDFIEHNPDALMATASTIKVLWGNLKTAQVHYRTQKERKQIRSSFFTKIFYY